MAAIFFLGDFSLAGVADGAAALIGFTGLAAGTGRYAATLLDRTDRETDRATAIGFFLGLAIGVLILLMELSE